MADDSGRATAGRCPGALGGRDGATRPRLFGSAAAARFTGARRRGAAHRHRFGPDNRSVTLSPDHARLSVTASPSAPTSAVLVLHGGSVDSTGPVRRWSTALLRLVPVARAVAEQVPSAAVYRLRFSVRGWNGDGAAVLRDAHWAVRRITQQHPGIPIVTVGHSLGGRVAVQTARTEPGVVGAVGLAPWLVADDPVQGLDGVPLFVVHGTSDGTIPEESTHAWLTRARSEGAVVQAVLIERGDHPMLRFFRRWHALAAEGVQAVLAAVPPGTDDQPGGTSHGLDSGRR